jgi:hypothetical protein
MIVSKNIPRTKFLLNVALLGIEMTHFDAAREILRRIERLDPQLPLVRLMFIFLESRARGGLDGRHMLLQLIAEAPKFQMAKAMLALMDRQAAISGWRGLAESVLIEGGDETATRLAEIILGFSTSSPSTAHGLIE